MQDKHFFNLYSFYILIFCFIILFFVSRFGFNYPTPWEDESAFLHQSLGFYRHNTLFSSALSDNRTIMWMQPGYMVVMGFIYKLFGYSYAISRHVSLFAYLVCFIIITRLVQIRVCSHAIIIPILFFLTPANLVCANIARMDVFILLLSLITLISLLNKRYLIVIALMIMGVLTHFNMVYIAAPIAFILLNDLRENGLKKFYTAQNIDFFILFFTIALFICYINYVNDNYASFVQDMAFQFSRKLSRKPIYTDFTKTSILIFISLFNLYTLYYAKRLALIFFSFSLSFYMIWGIGKEMWYAVFLNAAIMMFILGLWTMLSKKPYKYALTLFTCILFLLEWQRGFAGMHPQLFQEEYIDKSTLQLIENKIIDLNSDNKDHKKTISFVNEGDELFFIDFLEKNNIEIIHRLPFDNSRIADICVFINKSINSDSLLISRSIPEYNYALITTKTTGELNTLLK
ncbi:hypothetical protein [Methylomonas sp. AM2-LC]|uniref:hypothetical protein n=1 Tax=Methylomonas sp. AM2-LC TaxID=3153301 RepID=UPI00326356E4